MENDKMAMSETSAFQTVVLEEDDFHLPYYALNPTLVEYIECVARMTQSPVDFVVSTIFAFASGAAGNRILLKDPKGYLNPPVLWICLLALSGIGKTPVLTAISKPFDDMEYDLQEQFRKDHKEWRNKGASDDDMPIRHHVYVSTATLEGMGKILAAEQQGCILYRDELSGWFRDFGRYSGSASGDVQGWLNIWDGKTYVTALATKEVETVVKPTLALIGGTQPEELPRILTQPLFDDGLVARLLWCFPKCIKPLKYLTEPIPDHLSSFWEGLISKLYAMNPMTIQMTPEAQRLFIEYWEKLAELNAKCANPEKQKFIPKLQIYVEKWAIMCEVLSSRWCDPSENQINIISVGEDAMRMAIEAMECFRKWSEKVVQTVFAKTIEKFHGKEESIRSILHFYPKVTQSGLAKLLGVSPQHINQVLKG